MCTVNGTSLEVEGSKDAVVCVFSTLVPHAAPTDTPESLTEMTRALGS